MVGVSDRRLVEAIRAAIMATGGRVDGVAQTTADVRDLVAEARPDLVVAGLDLLGTQPVDLVRQLRRTAPVARLLVLVPRQVVPEGLVEAGADAVLVDDDIPGLRAALRMRPDAASTG